MHNYETTVGPFIVACNRESVYLKVNKEFQVEATEKLSEASYFYIVRLDEDRYFSIVYEVSNVDDLKESIKRKFEEECGKYKPGISLYLSASVNWRGRSQKNKPLQMQMSGKRFLTQMALQSRRSKHFQPAKLTEWTSGKEVFFIRLRKRTTSGPRRNDSYLCVHKHSQTKKPIKGRDDRSDDSTEMPIGHGKDDPLEGKASDNQPAQDNNDQSERPKATQSSKSHDEKPEGEATQTGQDEVDQAEGKSSQGNIKQAQGESSQGLEQAVEEATQVSQSKNDKTERKSSQGNIEQTEENGTKSSQNSDNQSDKQHRRDNVTPYSVGCEPRINKHDDENTFMLFRLMKPIENKGMYLET